MATIIAAHFDFETMLLMAFAGSWAIIAEKSHVIHFYWLIALLAVAMGLQSAAMSRLTIAGVTNTAMTGTLTSLAVGLEGFFFRVASEDAQSRRRMFKQIGVIVFYLGGAMANGWLSGHANWAMGIVPAGIALVVLAGHVRKLGMPNNE